MAGRPTPLSRSGPGSFPVLACALLALKFAHIVPSDAVALLVLAGILLGGSVFAAVHHAEVLRSSLASRSVRSCWRWR